MVKIVPNFITRSSTQQRRHRAQDKPHAPQKKKLIIITKNYTNKKAVLPQGKRAMPQVFFSVEVRQQHSLYKTSQASKAAKLRSSKHAGAKRNLTQNQDSKSIKVTCLESVEKQ